MNFSSNYDLFETDPREDTGQKIFSPDEQECKTREFCNDSRILPQELDEIKSDVLNKSLANVMVSDQGSKEYVVVKSQPLYPHVETQTLATEGRPNIEPAKRKVWKAKATVFQTSAQPEIEQYENFEDIYRRSENEVLEEAYNTAPFRNRNHEIPGPVETSRKSSKQTTRVSKKGGRAQFAGRKAIERASRHLDHTIPVADYKKLKESPCSPNPAQVPAAAVSSDNVALPVSVVQQPTAVGPVFDVWAFPKLNFLGFWNYSNVASDYDHAAHLGVSYIGGNYMRIEVVSGLVEILATYLSTKTHDKNYETYQLLKIKAASFCREKKDLTPEQVRTSVLYAPVIAYEYYWQETQNVSRVVTQSYAAPYCYTNQTKFVALLTTLISIIQRKRIIKLAGSIRAGNSLTYVTFFMGLLGILSKFTSLNKPKYTHNLDLISTALLSSLGVCGVSAFKGNKSFLGRLAVGYSANVAFVCLALTLYKWWVGVKSIKFVQPSVDNKPNIKKLGGNLGAADATKVFHTENSAPSDKGRRPGSNLSVLDAHTYTKFKEDDATSPRVEQVAMADSGYRPRCFENNLHNQKIAVEARILAATPEPNTKWIEEYINWVKINFKKLLGEPFKVKPIDFETYLKNSNATPNVKASLKRTHIWLTDEGYDQNSQLTNNQCYKWTIRSSFSKVEFTNHRTPAGLTNKAPRLIQGGRPEYICLVGPFIAALQGVIKSRWNKKAAICFASGLNSCDIASVLNQHHKIFEDDVSAFDASFCKEMLELEVYIVKQFGAGQAVVGLMEANCNSHGVTSQGLKYKRDGGRCSGDPYTSLFNSVQNGLMHVFIYMKQKNLTIDETLRELRMCVSGDDNIGSHPGYEVDWNAGMLKFGFKSKALYRPDPTQAEFCSTRLTPVKEGWTFCPKVGRVINKISWCVDRPRGLNAKALVKGTALSLYQQSMINPILKAYLDRIIALTKDEENYVPPNKPWEIVLRHCTPTVETKQAIYDIYGWSDDRQARWEAYLATCNLDTDMDHPLLTQILEKDTDGPSLLYDSGDCDDLFDVYKDRYYLRPLLPTAPRHGELGQWKRDLTTEGIEPNPGPASIPTFDREYNRLAAALSLSQNGAKWVRTAIDPFHDDAMKMAGYPDNRSSNSVVMEVKASIPISTTLTSAVDIWFIQRPICNPTTLVLYSSDSDALTETSDATLNINMVDVYIVNAGAGIATPTDPVYSYNLPANFTNSEFRVIAGGMEVYNTSPELNISGTTTVFTAPVRPRKEASTFNVVTQGATVANFTALLVDKPPSSLTDVLLFPGTSQWLSRDGAYVPMRLNSYELATNYVRPVPGMASTSLVLKNSDNTGWLGPSFTNRAVPVSSASVILSVPTTQTMFVDCNYTGIVMSNCSYLSTFNLELRYFIEVFPSAGDTTLLTLSTPSPSEDTQAYALYGRLMSILPVGVPVCENGLGDWFRGAVDTVSGFVGKAASAVSSIASAIPLPFTQKLASVADSVGTVANTVKGVTQGFDNNTAPVIQSSLSNSPSRVKATNGWQQNKINKLTRQPKLTQPQPVVYESQPVVEIIRRRGVRNSKQTRLERRVEKDAAKQVNKLKKDINLLRKI